MTDVTTAALVGATGGAGTTRTVVELAATLAGDDLDVAVLDAAYATQGLGDYVPGRLDPDVTRLVTDERETPLAAGLVELPLDLSGRVASCPARSPFERLARAKSAGAARALEDRIAEAATDFDVVLVDVPPVAANQSVAAATTCDRTALVTPATDRGRDAIQRASARLDDVGSEVSAVVATRGRLADADVNVPETDVSSVEDAPAVLEDDDLAASMVDLAAELLDRDVSAPGDGRLLGALGGS